MGVPRPLRPLRHRRYAMLWTGAFLSNVGTWMETVAVGILVTAETDQAGWTGLVAAAAFVPSAFFGPLGGALADRVPRRPLLLTMTVVQTGLAVLLTVLAAVDAAHPGVVVVIVLVAGCAQAIGFPAYQATIPDLVPTEDLTGAVALGAAQWNLGRVIGPALAGIVIAAGGYEWAFGINAASFVAVIIAVAPLRLPPPHHTGESVIGAIRDGWGYAATEPGLRAVVTYAALTFFLAGPFIALVPAMALTVLHAGTAGTSALVTAQGVGAVIMALALGTLTHRFGPRPTVLFMLGALPVALVGYALAPTLAVAVIGIFFVGLVYLGAFSSFFALIQHRTPARYRGRVLSLIMVLLGTVYPIGAVLQGGLADRVGLRATTAGAGIALGAALGALHLLRPGFSCAIDVAVDADAGTPVASAPA
jgi:MFS family permease